MTHRTAISILMLSPIYFLLKPVQRWSLIKEYCRVMNECELMLMPDDDNRKS